MGNAQSAEQSSVAMDRPTSYPIVIRTTTNNKKPQPFTGSFFNTHMAEPVPHQHVKKPNRPAGHINFFEVASVTVQPASVKSIHTNSSSSSLKTSSKKSSAYPASSINHSNHHSKKLNSSASSTRTSSSTSSSVASTTVAADNNNNNLKPPFPKDPDYVVLDGRRYWKGHGSQNFILPCDDDENDRLMTLHYILKSTFHGNFISPIQGMLDSETNRTKVLDIGCGSGTWILEMATEFPDTEFYGIDEYPLFPTSIKPGNSHFKCHNVLKGLPFKDCEFDFVYMRLMILYFTPEELSFLLQEISRVMKPGAYFEIVDTSYIIRSAGPVSNKVVNTDFVNLLHKSSTVSASSYESNTHHPIFSFLMHAPQQPASSFIGNFIDISQEHSMLPLGGWGGGQIGNLHGTNFKQLLTSVQTRENDGSTTSSMDEKMSSLSIDETMTTKLPLPKNTVNSILDECERYKSYLDWFACYARKPMVDDELEQSTLDSIYEFVEGFVDV